MSIEHGQPSNFQIFEYASASLQKNHRYTDRKPGITVQKLSLTELMTINSAKPLDLKKLNQESEEGSQSYLAEYLNNSEYREFLPNFQSRNHQNQIIILLYMLETEDNRTNTFFKKEDGTHISLLTAAQAAAKSCMFNHDSNGVIFNKHIITAFNKHHPKLKNTSPAVKTQIWNTLKANAKGICAGLALTGAAIALFHFFPIGIMAAAGTAVAIKLGIISTTSIATVATTLGLSHSISGKQNAKLYNDTCTLKESILKTNKRKQPAELFQSLINSDITVVTDDESDDGGSSMTASPEQ